METVNIREFEAHVLNYLTRANHGEQINISSNGQVLASITMPIDEKQVAKNKLKALAKKAKIHDVVSPLGETWDVMK